ncbi:PREDICTED: uncharacterized protein LOC109210947 [Nicotiana attenuata]|uniref:uncharacterized protein LOC109210947 n=1 Tax=Nicotiana attenuata TaxID=49451 RepID=UPI000904AC10|nr:PREDICTED: uncharacterized protein LOC109210947 [Nicotiana attenuata]
MHSAWEYRFFAERHPFKNKILAVETRWHKPPINTIKLNCDGAFSSTSNAAGMGGCFRNSNGDWILGYQKRTHAASPIHAELLALLEGLRIALDFRDTNLEIETDSTNVIKLLHEEGTNFQNVILECRWLMHRLKLPILRHNFREGNEVAHRLAKEALRKDPSDKCFYLARPPLFVQEEIQKDKQDSCNSLRTMSTNVCNFLATLGNSNALNSMSNSCNSFVK